MRRGVTLIELLFVMAIIGILVAMSMGAYSATVAQAKVHRTQAIVAKLDQLVLAKWEEYRTRAVPLKVPMGTNPDVAARARLYALRELQRCEMPDRKTDVLDNPAIIAAPSLQKNYRRRAVPGWTEKHEGAECLYLIVAAMRDGEDAALSWFSPSEIGDTDGDGMNEILDGFGQPVEFLRWASGYVAEDGPVTFQTRDSVKAPDEFDPIKRDPRWSDSDTTFAPYSLRPLVFSAGPDKEYGIGVDPRPSNQPLRYSTTTPPNDPYFGWDGSFPMIGVSTGTESADNITNHDYGDK